jgi:pimeloyl-ACP methyl ester carboxylesterase
MILKNNTGMTTFYEEYGDYLKPSLLLLHGIGADNNMWNMQKELYEKKGFHIIIPDLLAHGKSSKVKTLSLEDWSNQIEELIDYLKVEKVTLIGVSMGGVIAQHFITSRPERVERLIISDSFGEIKTLSEKMLGFSQVVGFKLFKILGNKMLAKGMASTYKANHAILAKKYFSDVCMDIDLDQMIIARKAINKIDVLEKLKNVNIPSMVLVGKDFGKSFIRINNKIAKSLGTELVVIDNSMDPSNLVNPDKFNNLVLEFMGQSRS